MRAMLDLLAMHPMSLHIKLCCMPYVQPECCFASSISSIAINPRRHSTFLHSSCIALTFDHHFHKNSRFGQVSRRRVNRGPLSIVQPLRFLNYPSCEPSPTDRALSLSSHFCHLSQPFQASPSPWTWKLSISFLIFRILISVNPSFATKPRERNRIHTGHPSSRETCSLTCLPYPTWI